MDHELWASAWLQLEADAVYTHCTYPRDIKGGVRGPLLGHAVRVGVLCGVVVEGARSVVIILYGTDLGEETLPLSSGGVIVKGALAVIASWLAVSCGDDAHAVWRRDG